MGSCSNSTRVTIVVQGLAALYVLEPDAVGLLANGGCANRYGYKANLITAIKNHGH